MDWKEYKNSVANYSYTELIEQYQNICELKERCWNNAIESYGEDSKQWFEQHAETEQQLKVLQNELSFRHINI